MRKSCRAYCKVGERIASLARNQTELGCVLGIGQQTVSTKLRGKSAILVSDLEKLARHYDIPVTFFFEEPAESSNLIGCREFNGMSPEAQKLICLASTLSEDDVRKILAMAQLLVGDTGKTGEPTRPSTS